MANLNKYSIKDLNSAHKKSKGSLTYTFKKGKVMAFGRKLRAKAGK